MARSSLGTQHLHNSASSFQQNTVTLDPTESYEGSSCGYLNLESASIDYNIRIYYQKIRVDVDHQEIFNGHLEQNIVELNDCIQTRGTNSDGIVVSKLAKGVGVKKNTFSKSWLGSYCPLR